MIFREKSCKIRRRLILPPLDFEGGKREDRAVTLADMAKKEIKYDYSPEYAERMVSFFLKDKAYEEKEEDCVTSKGVLKRNIRRANKIPVFSAFARELNVPTSALQGWKEKYPEFALAYDKCKEIQKEFIVENMVNGIYNPAAGIFTAKNLTDMRDSATVEMAGTDGRPLKIHLI